MEFRLLNLTQHESTKDQKETKEGDHIIRVVDIPAKESIKELLNFEEIPTKEKLKTRSGLVASAASEFCKKFNCQGVMIGGAPYFMRHLEEALERYGIPFTYSFSKRVSVEIQKEDGSVMKASKFQHEGWI